MENIKNKYDQYESPFDEMAWQHFQDLQPQEPKRDKRPYIAFLILGILCVLGWFLMNIEIIKKEDTSKTLPKTQKKTSQTLAIDSYNDSNIIMTESSVKNRVTNTHTVKPTYTLTKTSTNNLTRKKHKSTKNDIYNTDLKQNRPINTQLKNKKTKLFYIKNNDTKNVDNSKTELNITKLPTLLNSVTGTTVSEMPEYYPSLPVFNNKSSETNNNSNKNFIGINTSYIDSYINGSRMIEGRNIVNKKGVLLSLEYYYKLNNIIQIGASVGYSYTSDINNKSLEEVDYEKITFLHLNTKLHLLNNNRHKLYVKAGSGFTNTIRNLSYTSSTGSNQREEYFTKNITTHLGLLLEAGYQYKINQSLLIGTHIGSISGNDGGVYLGTSLTKSF